MTQTSRVTDFAPASEGHLNVPKLIVEKFTSTLNREGTVRYTFAVNQPTPIYGYTTYILKSVFDNSQSPTPLIDINLGNKPAPMMAGQYYESGYDFITFTNADVQDLQWTLVEPKTTGAFYSLDYHRAISVSLGPSIDVSASLAEVPDLVDEETLADAITVADEIKDFLSLSDEPLGKIIGVGRTTLVSWRTNRHNARPSNIASVMELHALIIGLRRALGDAVAREWFYQGDRLEKLATDGRAAILAEANRAIFRDAPRTWEAAYVADSPHELRD